MGRESRFRVVVSSYRSKGVSLVLAGSVAEFTEGAIRYVRAVQGLGRVNIKVCFRGRGVGALSRGDRLFVAVLTSITRKRSRGVSDGGH